jgi:hypothetical protein
MADQQEKAEVPEGGGSVSFERVKLYLDRHPEIFNLAGEIDWHDGYVGQDWPHRGYALARKDVESLLSDCEEYQQEAMEARRAANNLVEQKKEWTKNRAQVQALNDMVLSMRFHGARHHFVYAHQKYDVDSRRYVDHCRDCDKERDHPGHFGSSAKYMDSREVEKASRKALERVEDFLKGLGIGPSAAVARELLEGLPGVETKEGS